MSVVSTHGRWSVSVRDNGEAAFEPVGWRRSVIAPSQPATESEPIRAHVELKGTWGPSSVAVVGGEWSPVSGESAIEVAEGGELTLGALADVPTESGPTLVRGLPGEFVAAVLEGFIAAPCEEGVVAGLYRIDRGAYDETESSQLVLNRAAGILRCVLGGRALGRRADPVVLVGLMGSWGD